jgi:DNA-directed RNA polymerase specialized sigma subunit
MIANESEYQEATKRLTDEQERLAALTQRLRLEGKTDTEVKRVTDPMWSFHLQLAEEVESYERLCRGQFSEIQNLHGLGRLLIGLRIARGMSQRELAEKLGVHESQVSRDERNEYHGLTVQRAARILDVLGARLTSHVELDEIAVE